MKFTVMSRTVIAGALLMGPAAGWPADERQLPKMSERDQYREIQQALNAKGNDPGPIDGRMGPRTRSALKAFQEVSGLKATGRLDDQTIESLGLDKEALRTNQEAR